MKNKTRLRNCKKQRFEECKSKDVLCLRLVILSRLSLRLNYDYAKSEPACIKIFCGGFEVIRSLEKIKLTEKGVTRS